jgi:hypothetical protein
MYPDISHIFAAKAQRRRMLAALSWEEKVAIIERMRTVTKDMWKEVEVEHKVYPVWARHNVHDAATTLRDALEEDNATYVSSNTIDSST